MADNQMELLERLARIEAKLDVLIEALAADDELPDDVLTSLDGLSLGGERGQGQPL